MIHVQDRHPADVVETTAILLRQEEGPEATPQADHPRLPQGAMAETGVETVQESAVMNEADP